jgi:hypothetical protein
MRILIGLLLATFGCKSGWRSESEPLSTAQSTKPCNDVCANRVENPQILGCVTTCDVWSTRNMKVLAGGPKDKSHEPSPSCDLFYELRELREPKDSSDGLSGSWHQAFSFGFKHSKGSEDSGYLSFSIGLDSASRLVDFSKPESRRTLQRDFNGSNIIAFFQRKDASQGNLPTFSVTEANLNVTKILVVVMDDKFDPKSPFAGIKFARYQENRKGALIHDFECSE